MKKPSLIKRFFSFLLRLCVVLVLMAAIAVGSFEGVTYYLTGSFTSVKKAVKEETDQSGTEDSTEATTVDNKNMENTLVFVHDDMNNKDYTALNMYNTKTEAMDVLLLPYRLSWTDLKQPHGIYCGKRLTASGLSYYLLQYIWAAAW